MTDSTFKYILLLLLFVMLNYGTQEIFGQTVVKQGPAVPSGFSVGTVELDLCRMINDYRQQNNLPSIPLSRSLSYVAALHAKDLYLNHPDQGPCNFHSWSPKGIWKPFCYPRDENKKNSVWDKARELTKYPSKAYEIVYWENNALEKDTIMMVWRTEEYFNSFLLNSGKWTGKTWNAIGIAVYENYACAWFGEEPDPEIKINTPKAEVQPVKKSDPVKNEIIAKTDSSSVIYYIIVKTNLSPDASNKLVNDLKVAGYAGAKVLGKDVKLRISAFQTTEKSEAMSMLKEIKKVYKDAWLLKQ